jgi:hypothetical protein
MTGGMPSGKRMEEVVGERINKMRLLRAEEFESLRWILYQFHKAIYTVGNDASLLYVIAFPL